MHFLHVFIAYKVKLETRSMINKKLATFTNYLINDDR